MATSNRKPDSVQYPDPLAAAEDALVAASREARLGSEQPAKPRVGVALSGGGIRSATFSLGVFQGLARLGLLRHVDYLSTVSGGGYFGSAYGAIFARESTSDFGAAEDTIAGGGEERDSRMTRWLRENGRYLAPNGSGDLLLGGAVMLRNWFSVQLVMALGVFTVFLALQGVRVMFELLLPELWSTYAATLTALSPEGWLWWSPFGAVALALLAIWVVPAGWAYWLLGDGTSAQKQLRHLFWVYAGPGVVILAAVAGIALLDDLRLRATLVTVLLAAVIAIVISLVTRPRDSRRSGGAAEASSGSAATSGPRAPGTRHSAEGVARRRASEHLRLALVVTLGAVLFALVDSLGQTAYVALTGETLFAWLGGIVAACSAAAMYARRFVVGADQKAQSGRPSAGVVGVANVAAACVLLIVLTTLDAASHAVAWEGASPDTAPGWLSAGAAPRELEPRVQRDAAGEERLVLVERIRPVESVASVRSRRNSDLAAVGAALAAGLLLSLLIGRVWSFVNASSYHPLYSARLARAYLGASNENRDSVGSGAKRKTTAGQDEGDTAGVTRPVAGDDLAMESYWRRPGPGAPPSPFERGAPVHLINVTINETYDGRSRIQQQDRKGTGMAVGPCGISVGVRHHAVLGTDLPSEGRFEPGEWSGKKATVFGGERFRVFEFANDEWLPERLPIGRWVAISGAAFSTGIGYRTSIALSLLCGLANVRLGYWWYAGVARHRRWARWGPLGTQRSLGAEYAARFPGTARTHWYLSDGGHFENMGAYELVRRELPFIVVVDAEADPDYTLSGLANLVRKARIDFGARIEFLDARELDDLVAEGKLHSGARSVIGSLDQLKRRTSENAQRDLSERHVALARIYYAGTTGPDEAGLMLYVKPTLIGDEPADLAHYHAANPAFPQEPTSDQFFDEAQWESYRMLGEHIARLLFDEKSAAARQESTTTGTTTGAWAPWTFVPLGRAAARTPTRKKPAKASSARKKSSRSASPKKKSKTPPKDVPDAS